MTDDGYEAARNPDYRFDVQLAEGLAAEAWFYEMTKGGDRYEVKHDKPAIATGNLYVECQDDPGARGTWRPSGIAHTEADCWIFVLGDPPIAFVGVPTERLLRMARAAWQANRRGNQPHGSCPTQGALVRIEDALGLRRRYTSS